MKKSRFTEEQIIGLVKQAEAGIPVKERCRKGGFSDASFYKCVPNTAAWMFPMPDGCENSRARTPSSRSYWPKPT